MGGGGGSSLFRGPCLKEFVFLSWAGGWGGGGGQGAFPLWHAACREPWPLSVARLLTWASLGARGETWCSGVAGTGGLPAAAPRTRPCSLGKGWMLLN